MSEPVFRLIAVTTTAILLSGCTHMLVPYINSKPLNDATTCVNDANKPCNTVEGFIKTRNAVKTVQVETFDSAADRAQLNSLSSSLAFPLAGLALYHGVNPAGDSAQKNLLKWGLGVGAAYEVKNTLIANSPESIYMLSSARLSCVLREAGRYRLDFPEPAENCDAKAASLTATTNDLEKFQIDEVPLQSEAGNLITQSRNTIAQYENRERILQEATGQMQSAAHAIIDNTNAALKSPNIAFSQATSLMTSEMAAFKPAKTSASAEGAQNKDDNRVKAIDKIKALITELNTFGNVCVRSQPITPAFASCTSYSPEAPPAPTISTTLSSDSIALDLGGQLSFVATSTPIGTPWAAFTGDTEAATAAMGTPQLITLSPNQTQITLRYAKLVKADTKVFLSLTTVGVAGTAKSIEITLKAAAPQTSSPVTAPGGPAIVTTVKIPDDDPKWVAARSNQALLNKLLLQLSASTGELRTELTAQWTKRCPGKPADDLSLLRKAFADAIIADKKEDQPAYCN